MATITPEQIRDISVSTVEGFLNNNIPLSMGLAKRASDLGLNSEQIKRGVEATNSIAYLKILSISPDRTVEFPLCKYAEVIGDIVSPPEAVTGVVKEASAMPPAVAPTEEQVPVITHDMLVKAAAINKKALARNKDRAITLQSELIKTASAVGSQADWMNKLASITDEKEFRIISKLISYGPLEYRDFNGLGLFKEAELKDVTKLQSLYKEALALIDDIALGSDLAEKVEALEKQAFIGAILRGASGLVARGVGKIVSAPFRAAGNALAKPLAPIMSGASSDLAGASGLAQKAKIIGSTGIKALGAEAGTIGAGIAGAASLGMTGASIAGDASLYTPGTSASGQSKDIWSALQKN